MKKFIWLLAAIFVAVFASQAYAQTDHLSSILGGDRFGFPSIFPPPTSYHRQRVRFPTDLAFFPTERGACAAGVRRAAEEFGVPVRIALAVARLESGCRMSVRSWSGARGPLQILPSTARRMGCAPSLACGVRYLAYVIHTQGRFGMCAAISAYNHGEGFVACTRYGRTVLNLAAGAQTFRAAGWYAEYHGHHRHRHR